MQKTIFVVMNEEGKIGQVFYTDTDAGTNDATKKLEKISALFATDKKDFELMKNREFAVILAVAKNGIPFTTEISNSETEMVSFAKSLAIKNINTDGCFEIMVVKYYVYDGWAERIYHRRIIREDIELINVS